MPSTDHNIVGVMLYLYRIPVYCRPDGQYPGTLSVMADHPDTAKQLAQRLGYTVHAEPVRTLA